MPDGRREPVIEGERAFWSEVDERPPTVRQEGLDPTRAAEPRRADAHGAQDVIHDDVAAGRLDDPRLATAHAGEQARQQRNDDRAEVVPHRTDEAITFSNYLLNRCVVEDPLAYGFELWLA